MSDNDELQMKDFMISKNSKEIQKEKIIKETEENTLPQKQRALNKEIKGKTEDPDRYMLLARIINFFVILPIGLVLITGAVILFVKMLPYVIFLLRALIIKILI